MLILAEAMVVLSGSVIVTSMSAIGMAEPPIVNVDV